MNEYLRFSQVRKMINLSRSTIWRLEAQRQFPARRQLTTKTVGWLRSEVEEWMTTRNKITSQV